MKPCMTVIRANATSVWSSIATTNNAAELRLPRKPLASIIDNSSDTRDVQQRSFVAAVDCAGPPRRLQLSPMGVTVNLTHHFLIAMPAMADPHFANTLTYVCEHNPEGALGIVVNKPIDMTLSVLFEQLAIP